MCTLQAHDEWQTHTHTRALPESKLETWKEQSSLRSTRTAYCISVFVYWKGINWVLRIDNWTIEIKPFECTQRHTVWISLGKNYARPCKKVRLLFIHRISSSARAFSLPNNVALWRQQQIRRLKSFGTNKYHNNNLYVISSADSANSFRKNQWRIHVSRQLPRKWFIEVNEFAYSQLMKTIKSFRCSGSTTIEHNCIAHSYTACVCRKCVAADYFDGRRYGMTSGVACAAAVINANCTVAGRMNSQACAIFVWLLQFVRSWFCSFEILFYYFVVVIIKIIIK